MGSSTASSLFPDLAPTDYPLSGSLQLILVGKWVKKTEELRNRIDEFFASKPAFFFADGIHALPKKWQKITDATGEYFENSYLAIKKKFFC